MKIDYLDGPLRTYIERLASPDPVPGGGSAAALSLSTAAALLSMVARFTIGKKRFASFEPEAKEILSRTESIRMEAEKLIEEDSTVYLGYRRAVEMGREDPARTGAMLEATRAGNKLLRRMVFLTEEVLKLAEPLLKKGNSYLLSDVACAASFARTAFEAAEINILINLSGGLELPEKEQLKNELETMRKSVISQAGSILDACRERMR